MAAIDLENSITRYGVEKRQKYFLNTLFIVSAGTNLEYPIFLSWYLYKMVQMYSKVKQWTDKKHNIIGNFDRI